MQPSWDCVDSTHHLASRLYSANALLSEHMVRDGPKVWFKLITNQSEFSHGARLLAAKSMISSFFHVTVLCLIMCRRQGDEPSPGPMFDMMRRKSRPVSCS